MKGALLFAFNNDTVDYFEMANYTAKRINKFLNLPVSVVTDSNTNLSQYSHTFDNVFVQDSDKSNIKNNKIWINKGRYKAFELSPYTETLLLDTDYMVNSNQLSTVFDLYDDFMCHESTGFVLNTDAPQENISSTSFRTLWATVMFFKKTQRVKQLFQCMKMVQENYMHYVNLYNMQSTMYRNDYSLTIALRIVNGQSEVNQDYIPWKLKHVSSDVSINRIDDTKYIAFKDVNVQSKIKTNYCYLNDVDFHCLDKKAFMDLTND